SDELNNVVMKTIESWNCITHFIPVYVTLNPAGWIGNSRHISILARVIHLPLSFRNLMTTKAFAWSAGAGHSNLRILVYHWCSSLKKTSPESRFLLATKRAANSSRFLIQRSFSN